MNRNRWDVAGASAIALIAFAANSILCRLALKGASYDPIAFTTVRLLAGALTLVVVQRLTVPLQPLREFGGTWRASFALYLYAITFSLAYVTLPVGSGALLLFGSVQTTMIVWGLIGGERPRLLEWIGLACAVSGLAYLVWPNTSVSSIGGVALMATAGVSWGVYSLLGRSKSHPSVTTTGNFVRTIPWVLITIAVRFVSPSDTLELVGVSNKTPTIFERGFLLAIISGAVTSGLGYVIWYRALKGLTATRAATIQLAVPILASLGGLLLGDAIRIELVVSAVLVLGGIGLAVLSRQLSRGKS